MAYHACIWKEFQVSEHQTKQNPFSSINFQDHIPPPIQGAQVCLLRRARASLQSRSSTTKKIRWAVKSLSQGHKMNYKLCYVPSMGYLSSLLSPWTLFSSHLCQKIRFESKTTRTTLKRHPRPPTWFCSHPPETHSSHHPRWIPTPSKKSPYKWLSTNSPKWLPNRQSTPATSTTPPRNTPTNAARPSWVLWAASPGRRGCCGSTSEFLS